MIPLYHLHFPLCLIHFVWTDMNGVVVHVLVGMN